MAGNVLVVGSINADDAIQLSRFPAPGETVSARALTTALGGKGANQAVAAARAGAAVRMAGAVGMPDGEPLVAALAFDGIDVAHVARLQGASSGRAVVLIDDDAENSIVVVPGTNSSIPAQAVEDACGSLRAGDVLLLQHEVPMTISNLAARLARTAGATVIWNAAPAPMAVDELIPDIDLLLVNDLELVAVAGLLGIRGSGTEALIGDIAATTGWGIVCTRGAAGAVYRIGDEAGTAEAKRVAAVDTTAAGDTFAGYFAALSDQPFPVRLRLALDAASAAVTRHGAAASIPNRTEVEQFTSGSLERSTI